MSPLYIDWTRECCQALNQALLKTLDHLGFSTWLRESLSKLAYPTILWLHIMGMGGGRCQLGDRSPAAGSFLKNPVQPLEPLYPLMWFGSRVNAVTGTALLLTSTFKRMADRRAFAWAGLICWLGRRDAGAGAGIHLVAALVPRGRRVSRESESLS